MPELVGASDGMPLLDDGRVIEAANVVWATGFRPDHRWIHLPITGPDGWPRQTRGVVTDVPGLFFIGLPFMYRGASALLGRSRPGRRLSRRSDGAPGRRRSVSPDRSRGGQSFAAIAILQSRS